MRNLLSTIFTLMTVFGFAQSKGTVLGKIQDKDMDLEPFPFVSVYVEGNSGVGTMSDFDGIYQLQLDPGTYTLVHDFVGYKTVKKQIVVTEGASIKPTIIMESVADALDAVVLTVVKNKESEDVLLDIQKEKVEIVESIGAEQLSKAGVSNAAAATAKISGVQKNESSGAVFIRGLGDRYLATTMNGLPMPSDDVEKKNVNLNLFPTNLIQNVSIRKTYNVDSYADQTSGGINISSKAYSKSSKDLKVNFGVSSNTNVLGKFNSFKTSQNIRNTNSLGFYSSSLNSFEAVTKQSWNPVSYDTPLNYNFSISGGHKFKFENFPDISFVASLSNSKSFEFKEGLFKNYSANELTDSYSDVEQFTTKYTNTALVDVKLDFNKKNNVRFANLFINKLSDNLYEAGRNGRGVTIDNSPEALAGSFVRDQNTKETRIIVNQILGSHELSDMNSLKWALGINNVIAREPNRIRNEFVVGDGTVLTDNTPVGVIVPSINNNFQQRKSTQKIDDFELNGFINDKHIFIDEEEKQFFVKGGLDFRYRTRDFESQFVGADAAGLTFSSLDDLSDVFKPLNFIANTPKVSIAQPDTYEASLNYIAAFVSATYKINKSTFDVGFRFENDEIKIEEWDVNNFTDPVTFLPRLGALDTSYQNFLPHLNVKHQLNAKNSIRISASKTTTLPEFKELAPFEYVSNTNRTTKGNPNLIASTNYNFDVKWEFFPSRHELLSVTGFYKNIKNPINYTIERGGAGNFTYDNTGKEANVYGLEAESRFNIWDLEEQGKLNLNVNATLMSHSQDLLETYQFNNVTKTDLTGASEVIVNAGINYSVNKDLPFNARLSANYSSDKIFALGAPRNQTNRATLFNDHIIEKGFTTLDLVVSKKVNEKLSFKLSAKNILNATIRQTQNVKDLTTGVDQEFTVSEYKKGVDFGMSATYSF